MTVIQDGLRRLLEIYDGHEVYHIDRNSSWVSVDLVNAREVKLWAINGGDANRPPALLPFAIWCATGNVYRVGPDGAVEDDPHIMITTL